MGGILEKAAKGNWKGVGNDITKGAQKAAKNVEKGVQQLGGNIENILHPELIAVYVAPTESPTEAVVAEKSEFVDKKLLPDIDRSLESLGMSREELIEILRTKGASTDTEALSPSVCDGDACPYKDDTAPTETPTSIPTETPTTEGPLDL